MEIAFSGRLALVTGGTRGIGAAIVDELLQSGARVIATGRTKPLHGDTTNEVSHPGVEFDYADFSDPAQTDAFAARMARMPVDLLVNNAGVNKISPAGEVTFDDWDRIQNVNVRAPFALCRAIVPKMAERGYGRIVNITSIFAKVTKEQRISYTTSKCALVGMTRTLAVDYAQQNVLANSVGPGFIDTELTRRILSETQREELLQQVPMGRLGQPSEIARVVAFLGSDRNTFITGQHIVADGGFTIV